MGGCLATGQLVGGFLGNAKYHAVLLLLGLGLGFPVSPANQLLCWRWSCAVLGPLHSTVQRCSNSVDVCLRHLVVLQGAVFIAGALANDRVSLAIIGCKHSRPVYVSWFFLGQLQ